jgi:hypothetical protein
MRYYLIIFIVCFQFIKLNASDSLFVKIKVEFNHREVEFNKKSLNIKFKINDKIFKLDYDKDYYYFLNDTNFDYFDICIRYKNKNYTYNQIHRDWIMNKKPLTINIYKKIYLKDVCLISYWGRQECYRSYKFTFKNCFK